MDAIHTKFATSASLRHTRFELYAFRSNITSISTTHKKFGQCIKGSQASKTYAKVALIAGNVSVVYQCLGCLSFFCGEVQEWSDHMTSHDQHGRP